MTRIGDVERLLNEVANAPAQKAIKMRPPIPIKSEAVKQKYAKLMEKLAIVIRERGKPIKMEVESMQKKQ
jgi:hypothetical protein